MAIQPIDIQPIDDQPIDNEFIDNEPIDNQSLNEETIPKQRFVKGRGALTNAPSRYLATQTQYLEAEGFDQASFVQDGFAQENFAQDSFDQDIFAKDSLNQDGYREEGFENQDLYAGDLYNQELSINGFDEAGLEETGLSEIGINEADPTEIKTKEIKTKAIKTKAIKTTETGTNDLRVKETGIEEPRINEAGKKQTPTQDQFNQKELTKTQPDATQLNTARNKEPPPITELLIDHAKTIITTNRSPDVPFDRSVNPYKGCEHGCIYCFARPTHAYWDLSPGLDFETKIFHKPNAAVLLEQEIAKPNYQCRPIAFGTNTDPYQPVDQQLQLTRALLTVLQKYRHPFTLVTKGSHVLRDLDIFADMATEQLCAVRISVTTLDNNLKRILEPRAASIGARLKAIAELRENKVPVGILMAPVIPMINDTEIESVLQACADAGATAANHLFLRLPLEVRDLFYQWLRQHFPERAEHVISLIRQSRNGRDNSSQFGTRMRGTGVFADLIAQRFAKACNSLGLNNERDTGLATEHFKKPGQLSLF